jgi:hypothetical protein
MLIEKVADNKTNQEPINLNPPDKVRDKLDYYRSLFNKTHDLPATEFEELKKNISTFFNLKPAGFLKEPPSGLIRISNNNRILKALGKDLSYLTEISQILAPPIQYCDFNRCNIPGQQVLYCSVNEASAYWEIKPRRGDVITISHFKLKPGAKLNCTVIKTEKTKDPSISHALQEVFYLLEEFFVDAYSLPVSRERQRDYIFSAVLSSEQLFYPVVSTNNVEAILYPSVQKKKYGQNIAIRNDLLLERYDIEGVETRFILDEYEHIDPATDELITDDLIGSFGTKTFDIKKGKILYDPKADEIFKLFRDLQVGDGKQTRFDNPEGIKRLAFDLSVKSKPVGLQTEKLPSRNDKVNVVYQNGGRKDGVKYKKIEADIKAGLCRIVI